MLSAERCVLAALLLLLLPLAGCGDLPQPYRGQPGGMAAKLVQPPAYRIAVPPPDAAMLTDAGSRRFASDLADALVAAEVPAVASQPWPLDWRLKVVASREGQTIVPRYTLENADAQSVVEARGNPVRIEEWAGEDPKMLQRVATSDAGTVATLLARADAARRAADPATLVANGPPRLRFIGVKGAPGDGDAALTTRMTDFLADKGFLVQPQAEGSLFSLEGRVNMVPIPDRQQRVEIQWIVTRKDGQEIGRAIQMNQIPQGTLNGLWGDVAYVVSQEAAQGVRDIINNAGGFGPPPTSPGGTGTKAPGGKPQAGVAPPAPAGDAASMAAPLLLPEDDSLPPPQG